MRLNRIGVTLCHLCLLVSNQAAGNRIVAFNGCTLVDAIQAAETDSAVGACPAGSGDDSIFLHPKREYRLTDISVNQAFDTDGNTDISGSFYLSISSNITLSGANATLIADYQQQNDNRNIDKNDIAVFLIKPNSNVVIRGVTIVGGTSAVRDVSSIPTSKTNDVKGAAITNFGHLSIVGSTFIGHQTHLDFIPIDAVAEPAVIANYGTLRIEESRITNNEMTALYTDDSAQTTLLRDTISSNRFFSGIVNRGQTDIANSLIAANLGSQIRLDAGSIKSFNNTIIGAITLEENTSMTLANTVLSNSHRQTCHFVGDRSKTEIIDAGHNWFQDDSCTGQAQGDPLLNIVNPVDTNDSITLLPDSPLIDAGDDSICMGELVSKRDISFVQRPQGRTCDIGAVELKQAPSGISVLKTITLNHRLKSAGNFPRQGTPLFIGLTPASFHGGQPGVARIKRQVIRGFVPAGFFQLFTRFQEFSYLDQFHVNEQVGLMGFYSGLTTLDDGTQISAENFTLSGNNQWKSIKFPRSFQNKPHLFVFAQTSHGGQPFILRVRNVTQNGFEVSIQEEEALMFSGHVPETIAYFAIDHPAGQGTIPIDGITTGFALQRIAVNHRWSTVFGKQIKLQEERSRDNEIIHVNELVDVMKLGEHIFAQAVTFNGADPFTIRMR